MYSYQRNDDTTVALRSRPISKVVAYETGLNFQQRSTHIHRKLFASNATSTVPEADANDAWV